MSNYGGNGGDGQAVRGEQDGDNQGGGCGQQRERKDPATMTLQERFDYAKAYRIGFGKYKNLELNQIACEDILYLDWLNKRDWLSKSCRTAMDTFFSDPRVAAHLEAAVAIKEIQVKARQRGGMY